MKTISLILCLLFCYQAFAKKPVDHGRVLKEVDFSGVTTFTPKSSLGIGVVPQQNRDYSELFHPSKLSELSSSFSQVFKDTRKIDVEMASDYVLAFAEVLAISKVEGHVLSEVLVLEYIKAYNELVKFLKIERGILDPSEFEVRDNLGKMNELHRLFEDLSYDLELNARIPEDNL